MIASAGIRLGEKTGWFSALRYRYFGPQRLIEDVCFGLRRDDRFFARPWSIVDGRQRPIGRLQKFNHLVWHWRPWTVDPRAAAKECVLFLHPC